MVYHDDNFMGFEGLAQNGVNRIMDIFEAVQGVTADDDGNFQGFRKSLLTSLYKREGLI